VIDMPEMESYEDIDVIWTDKAHETKPSALIIFMQGESGHASLVSSMSVIGSREPVARIYSRYQSVEPFNAIPDLLEPCWLVYELEDEEGDRIYLLRLTNWPEPNTPTDTTNWLWCYPMARDVVNLFLELGVEQLFMLTSVAHNEKAIGGSDLIMYDFHDKDMKGGVQNSELGLMTPCWIFCELYAKLTDRDSGNGYLSMLICVKSDNMGVDEVAVQHLVDFYSDSLGLKVDSDSTTVNEFRGILNSFETDGRLNPPFFDENDSSGGYHI
tara:strand:+ start:1509 stop:2318 length:810 start_codon:yes stop_codon:yes gene_type:complete